MGRAVRAESGVAIVNKYQGKRGGMGIFSRLSTLLRSNLNDLISRAENPEKMITQLITDMKSDLAKAKQEVAAAIADEKKLQQQVQREKKEAEVWEQRAMVAVREAKDDLAKQALMRHNEHVQTAVQMHDTWVKQKDETDKLKIALKQLNDKLEEAKRKKNLLIARQRRVEAQVRIQETMSSLTSKGTDDTFGRIEEKVDEMERKALASAELSEELSGDSLRQEFEELDYHGTADQQLIELKKKMGLLEAGSSDEPKQIESGSNDGVEEAEIENAEVEDDNGLALLQPLPLSSIGAPARSSPRCSVRSSSSASSTLLATSSSSCSSLCSSPSTSTPGPTSCTAALARRGGAVSSSQS